MKTAIIATFFLLVVGPACKPSVGSPISLIAGPSILAVKSVPAEVDPQGVLFPTATVTYEALAVDLNGRVPGPSPDADIADPLLWATCLQPKPPTDTNSVSSDCLDETKLPGAPGDSPTTYTADAPSTACALFGPTVPPALQGQPPTSPRAADVTGGYYLPIRVELLVPVNLRHGEMTTPNSIVGFQLQRIQCGLALAPEVPIREYNKTYTLNNNPVLSSLALGQPGSDQVLAPQRGVTGSPIPVTKGQTIFLTANWPADSVESYPAWDVLNLVLVKYTEAMRVSWYATSGSFEHDTTGVGGTATETFDADSATWKPTGADTTAPQTSTDNTWTPDTPGLVHMWLVLHDSRGGTDFAAYDFIVSP
jgi:hypothetical protein